MHFDIHVYIWYDYVMGFHLMMMLRSTTGPYGRLVIEVAYGEMIFSLHRGCIGDDSSGRVVGMSAWCIVHVWHTQVNTSVGSVYIFSGFSRYKNLYVLCFQIYTYYKITLVGSDLVLARWGSENVFNQRMFSTAHEFFFKIEIESQTFFMTYIVYEFYE